MLPGVKPGAEQGCRASKCFHGTRSTRPKAPPTAIIQLLNADAENHGATLTRQKLLSLGFERGGGTPEQLAEFARAERRKWGPIITTAGIKAE